MILSKRHKFTPLFVLILTLLAMSGCGDDNPDTPPSFSISADRLTFDSDGGERTFTVTSDADWSVTPSQSGGDLSWLNVTPASGGKGTTTVTVRAAANTGYDERSATVIATMGGESKTIAVTQKQRDALLLSGSKVELGGEGGTFDIVVGSNVEVTCEVPVYCESWLHPVSTRALTEKTYSFKADEYRTPDTRRGVIIFTGAGLTEEVDVWQTGTGTFLLTRNPEYISASGGNLTIELNSDVEYTWSITKGADWLHADDTRNMSSHTLRFTCDPYTTPDTDREATVEFRPEKLDPVTQTIVQRCQSRILLDAEQKDVTAAGGDFCIPYSSNRRMSVRTPVWVYVTSNAPATRGMEGYELWLRAAPNNLSSPRSGDVEIFDYNDSSVHEKVTLTQTGATVNVTTDLPDPAFDDARTHTFTIRVDANIPVDIVLPDAVEKLGGDRYRLKPNNVSGRSMRHVVNFSAGGYPAAQPLYLDQSSPLTHSSEKIEYDLPSQGGDAVISLKNNADVTSRIVSGEEWLSLAKADTDHNGMSIDSWTFRAAANGGEARTAEVTLANAVGWSQTFTVRQAGAAPGIPADGRITLTAPGQLASKLTDAQTAGLEGMALTGPLNGADIVTIRTMATEGKLTVLDLSAAELKQDTEHSWQIDDFYINSYKRVIERDGMVGNCMFYATNLTRIILPATTKEIGAYAFARSKLTDIEIPEGVTKMGTDCFEDCERLITASVPSTVKKVPDWCFFRCYALQKVTLREGLEEIGMYAFTPRDATSTQSSLTDVTIPSTVTRIGKWAFNCTRITSLTVPAGVTEIGPNAFKECRQLGKADMQCSLAEMPQGLFDMCTSLSDIRFPKGLKTVGKAALAHTAVPNLVIPEGVTCLEQSALEGAGKNRITLPSTLEYVGERALGQLSLVRSITIPAGVTELGKYAFGAPCYLSAIHMRPATPPADHGVLFGSGFDYPGCTLYVPAGSRSAYASHPLWGQFPDIREE